MPSEKPPIRESPSPSSPTSERTSPTRASGTPVRLRGDRQLSLGGAARAVGGLFQHGTDRAQRLAEFAVGRAAIVAVPEVART